MDGTLTRPVIDFKEMRRRLGLPEGDILAALAAAPPAERQQMHSIIEELENEVCGPPSSELSFHNASAVACRKLLRGVAQSMGVVSVQALASMQLMPGALSLCKFLDGNSILRWGDALIVAYHGSHGSNGVHVFQVFPYELAHSNNRMSISQLPKNAFICSILLLSLRAALVLSDNWFDPLSKGQTSNS